MVNYKFVLYVDAKFEQLLSILSFYNVDHILKINYACYLFPSPGVRPRKQCLELA